jgi:Matrixin
MLAPLVLVLALGQSADPYVRSRVEQGNPAAHCLFWTVPTLTWRLSSVGNPTSSDANKQREFEAIRRSFQSWQEVFVSCGNLRIEEGPLVDARDVGYVMEGTNRNLVLFRSRRCADVVASTDACWEEDTCGNLFDCWDADDRTIGLTLTTYDEKSGIIYDSDIQLNASAFVFTTGDGGSCVPPVSTADCVGTDVQNTMTHEIGHLLGLDHTQNATSTMYPRAPSGETSKRVVDPGSRDFVCVTYPQGKPSQSCVTPSVASSNANASLGPLAVGCAGIGAMVWLPSLAGLGLLLRRRRGGPRS